MRRLKSRAIFICFLFCYILPLGANSPLAVYLTWQRDPTTTMTIQWISPTNEDEEDLYYRSLNEGEPWKVLSPASFPMSINSSHTVYRVEIDKLQPGTSYIFRLGRRGFAEYKFRTMPAELDGPVRFVVGGDMYHDALHYMTEMLQKAANMDPMFCLVGGDIAYSATRVFKTGCDHREESRWLLWLRAWSEFMVTKEGFLIPFLPAIGNHDVNGRFDQPKENAAFFYSLFPFPGVQGYNVLDFGNYMSIFVLDSGHTNPIGQDQALWLFQSLKERQRVPHTFALYHVPAYPGFRRFRGEKSTQIRRFWVPSFDRFFLSAAFENHDHVYKRTKPLAYGKVDVNGVLYLGDGAFGVKKPRRPKKPSRTWYLEKSKNERHFILVTIDRKNRFYHAMNAEGSIIDSCAQTVQNQEKLSIFFSKMNDILEF